MSSDKLERVRDEYQAGKVAFEGGRYGQAVKHLEAASALVDRGSRLGGEVQMWLVTAYEAAGQTVEGIALCKQLTRHPHISVRQQARQVLYILEAPKLTKRPEWLVEIPDLGRLQDNESSRFKAGVGGATKSQTPAKPAIAEPVDLSQVQTQDNRFVWVAAIGLMLAIAGLIFFSSS